MFKFRKVMILVATMTALTACSKNEAAEQKTSAAPMEHMSHEKAAAMAQAVGVITAIDTKGNILTISHEAIAAINWPAMTMGFKVADPKLLNGLAVGQKVDFELKVDGEIYTIVSVKSKNM